MRTLTDFASFLAERRVRLVVFAAMSIAILAYSLAYHEPWRDEVQAMLLAREVPWSGLIAAVHIEGAPPLFHVLLKLLGAVLPSHLALVVGAAIGSFVLLSGTYALLAAISERPVASLVVTLVFGACDTFAYELGVVARQYGLSLGLAFFACAALHTAVMRDERASALRGGVLAGIAALAGAHAACVAGAAVAATIVIALARGRSDLASRALIPFLPCFLFTLYIIGPSDLRTVDSTIVVDRPTTDTYKSAVALFSDGIVAAGWWLDPAEANQRASVIVPTIAAIVLGFGARTFARRPAWRAVVLGVLTILVSWAPLAYISVFRYWGGYRHHLFLWTPAIVMAAGHALHATRGRDARSILALALRFASALAFVPWLLLEIGIARRDLARDARDQFSECSRAAPLFRENASVIAIDDAFAIGLLLTRPDLRLRTAVGAGREVRYLVADRVWHTRVAFPPLVFASCAAERAAGRTPKVYALVARGAANGLPSACATPVPHDRASRRVPDTFDAYDVDCACLAEKPVDAGRSAR